jgi:branched-chain amino acid aminotransferase
LIKLIETDNAWIPSKDGAALYLRPFMYASEARFGIKISEQYRFIIFSGPVPELYTDPIKVKVETEYIRAAKGGTGFAKTGGNYGGALYPTQLAREQGYDQLLWTTGDHDPHIEESGMMNVMFVINNALVTPPISDSILDGVTRDSLLTLAEDLGYTVEERRISVSELEKAFKEKLITEAFGTGTAAVVAPIKTIQIYGVDYQLPGYGNQSMFNKLKSKLQQIRTGAEPDLHEWNYIV